MSDTRSPRTTLWKTTVSICCVDGKSNLRHGSQSKIDIFGQLPGYRRIGRGYHANSSSSLVQFKPPNSTCFRLIIQFPFSVFYTTGEKSKELRKCRTPPSKVNQTFFVFESPTTTVFEVHVERTVKMGIYSPRPRCVVGTVYLGGSYLCQQDDVSTALSKECCLSLPTFK